MPVGDSFVTDGFIFPSTDSKASSCQTLLLLGMDISVGLWAHILLFVTCPDLDMFEYLNLMLKPRLYDSFLSFLFVFKGNVKVVHKQTNIVK